MKCKCGHDESEHIIFNTGDTDLACMVHISEVPTVYCECMKFEEDEAALRAQLAEAREVIEAVAHDRPTAHTDDIWLKINGYLAKYPVEKPRGMVWTNDEELPTGV